MCIFKNKCVHMCIYYLVPWSGKQMERIPYVINYSHAHKTSNIVGIIFFSSYTHIISVIIIIYHCFNPVSLYHLIELLIDFFLSYPKNISIN